MSVKFNPNAAGKDVGESEILFIPYVKGDDGNLRSTCRKDFSTNTNRPIVAWRCGPNKFMLSKDYGLPLKDLPTSCHDNAPEFSQSSRLEPAHCR